jgi:hypothetical protein
MDSKLISEFKKECKKNREYLGYSINDVCVCLDNVSEKEYKDFEESSYILSRDNIEKLMRVLCVSKPVSFSVNDYIDTDGLSEDEIEDLSKVIYGIVGEDND